MLYWIKVVCFRTSENGDGGWLFAYSQPTGSGWDDEIRQHSVQFWRCFLWTFDCFTSTNTTEAKNMQETYVFEFPKTAFQNHLSKYDDVCFWAFCHQYWWAHGMDIFQFHFLLFSTPWLVVHWCMHANMHNSCFLFLSLSFFLSCASHPPSHFYRWDWCKASRAGIKYMWCDQSVPCSLSQLLLWLTALRCSMLYSCSHSEEALHHDGRL